ncbi:ferritin-like domain-containing protein [Microvirga massiliensis]|uniref:ferritin-like domain-containing protein n=1 Tax=Microvirga massiliensis TaxID=1033741 RepID=UPI00062BADB2|nr:ferritin-like domain-containing protein [Microvirga massiliensis]
MATASTTDKTFTSHSALDNYITGLQNAHALEKQALQLMERQLERIENYPEVGRLLRAHIKETEGQLRRIDEILHSFGEDRSLLKDMATQISGNMAALMHTVMPDEILKNHFANHAFENYEIASYQSLITMAEATGHAKHVQPLQATLQEEENMAKALRDMTPDLTLKYMRLYDSGRKADR